MYKELFNKLQQVKANFNIFFINIIAITKPQFTYKTTYYYTVIHNSVQTFHYKHNYKCHYETVSMLRKMKISKFISL